ncbi:serine hydrolase domain-containing protein [Microbacterium sp. bgisy189]|uniref:serine hydrolase domain-containing protein n=1 Tax=Microbacterium sp. bgisy189 TaxID=3413798 RepID=UPI003EBAA928
MTAAVRVRDRIVAGVDAEGLGAYGVHVLVGDDEAAHRWRSDDRVNLYSVSKGVCALAAGMAIDEGVLALDTAALEVLDVPQPGAGTEGVTLEHLLTMRSGIDFQWFADQRVPWNDLAHEMLRHPAAPGAAFQYTDASPYVAMRMLAARVGDVRDWLMPRLFDPLGIHNPQWHRCPLGHIAAGSGLELRTDELARIGRLLRDRGQWQGEQLVSTEWVERMARDSFATGADGRWSRYGFGVWQGPGRAWRLDGRYGQYVIVDDPADAVVTITAHEEHRDHRLAELAASALAS